MSRNIKFEREFLMETYPEMAEEIAKASDTVIMICYDMQRLDKEQLEVFEKFLELRPKMR